MPGWQIGYAPACSPRLLGKGWAKNVQ